MGKMSLTWPLEDKRLLVLKEGIAVVVGYEHPPRCFVAYLKYVLGRGPWRGYRRVVPEYSPDNVKKYKTIYDPNFGSRVPIVCLSEVLEAPDPLERFNEVISSPKDRLEETVLSLASKLGTDLGVGGSLLLRIYHERSDVDLLVYGDPLEAWEELKEAPYLEVEESWPPNVARRTGLPLSTTKLLYTKALRAKAKGVPISFSYVQRRKFYNYGFSAAKMVGPYEGILELDELTEETFWYPHRRRAGELILESYESAFLKPMVECERVRVKGTLWIKGDGTKVVRVGLSETMGYVLPARPCY